MDDPSISKSHEEVKVTSMAIAPYKLSEEMGSPIYVHFFIDILYNLDCSSFESWCRNKTVDTLPIPEWDRIFFIKEIDAICKRLLKGPADPFSSSSIEEFEIKKSQS